MNNLLFEGKPDRWILSQRPQRNWVDPYIPYEFLVEEEYGATGIVEKVATIFLTNKECPFRCLMCDLWKNTIREKVPVGAIPDQMRYALKRLPPAEHIKLYNSGNFFDVQAIPPADHSDIIELTSPFKNVVVECHPKLVGKSCADFAEKLNGKLEVAMGLESVHPDVIAKLNKRMTLKDFEKATRFLVDLDCAVRPFILENPPFLNTRDGIEAAKRSIDFAFDIGVECCAIIPTRAGNGAMDMLKAKGLFLEPTIDALEEVLVYGLKKQQGRVFADLWDIEKFATCQKCLPARIDRMHQINLTQKIIPNIACNCCQDSC